jgi:hypothetical protein
MLQTFFHPIRALSRGAIVAEANALERELGYRGAVQALRDRIAHAERADRRRLYQLHDEIARKHGWAEA